LPYVVARAMFDGAINHHSFDPKKLRDPGILAFMRKITVKPDPTFDKIPRCPAGAHDGVPSRWRACRSSGRQYSCFSELPMTRADVERKFRSNIGTRWPQERTDVALQALEALDRTDNLSVLLSKLVAQT
jgi:2-methylcitrate dehydratase